MKRREFIKTTTAAVMGLMLGCQTSTMDSLKKKRRPNILFIMTDQQHAGMMSCTGNRWVKTPALDSLAASSIRFERAYCCNPVCGCGNGPNLVTPVGWPDVRRVVSTQKGCCGIRGH